MDKHSFVVINDLRPMMRRVDFESFFTDEQIEPTFNMILRHITEGVRDEEGIDAALDEVEDLVRLLLFERLVSDSDFDHDDTYAKLCGVLFSVCSELAQVLMDVGYYHKCKTYAQCQPKLLRCSRSNFTIVANPIRR